MTIQAPRPGDGQACAAAHRIGQILLNAGLVTADQLQAALTLQHARAVRLGELLCAMGLLDRATLGLALELQSALSSPERILATAAGPREPLGVLLLASGRITPAQLEDALAEQDRTGARLGRIAVRRGWLDEQGLERLLSLQRRIGRKPHGPGPLRLGRILVLLGAITAAQLDAALVRQAGTGRTLGEVLIDAGYATPRTVAQGLRLQRGLMAAAVAALLALGPGLTDAVANGAEGGVSVTARVLPYARLEVLAQPSSLRVTPADAARGYVEVDGVSRLAIRSNSPRGYALVVEGRSEILTGVVLRGLGPDVALPVAGGTLLRPPADPRAAIEVRPGYRFSLAPGTPPGDYPWPVTLSILPL